MHRTKFERVMRGARQELQLAWARVRSGLRFSNRHVVRPLRLAELEARLLLSASPIPVEADAVNVDMTSSELQADPVAPGDEGSVSATESASDTPSEVGAEPGVHSSAFVDLSESRDGDAPVRTNELVFVDTRVQDFQRLVDDLMNNQVDDRNLRVILLDATHSLSDVSAALAGSGDLDAVHFVSHAKSGGVLIGSEWLTAGNLAGHAGEIEKWRDALAPHGDVLFYGCDVAQTQVGQEFLRQFAVLTGSDVAASVDVTGHASLGGNWELEYRAGTVETAVVFSGEVQSSWSHLLPAAPASAVIALNQTTSDVQKSVDVAMFGNGSFVAVWDSHNDGSGEGVFARFFNASGSPTGNEFRINQTTLNQQLDPAIALAPNGDFVVTWTSTQGGNKDIYARVYNSAGTALTNEILINAEHTSGDQQNSDVAVDDSGNFVVVWELAGPGDATGVFAQRVLADGSLSGGIVRINNTTLGNQDNASVAIGASGNFVVTWTDRGGINPRITGQQFSASGVGQGEFAVQGSAVGAADLSSVAMDDSGKFVVTWGENNADISQYGVRMRRFDASGSPLTSDILVNTTTAVDQFDPAVAIDSDGDFVITWTSVDQDGDAKGVIARAFRSDGTPDAAGELLVNTFTSNDQHVSQVAMNDSGKFVVGWQGRGSSDSAGVFARLYSWSEAAGPAKPVISLPAGPVSYTLGNPLTIIDTTATVSDPDSPNFDTGTLTVSLTSGATVNDRLEIRDGGTIRLSGNVVEWKSGGPSVPIGTFSGGTDGFTPLVISLNANADPAKTQDLVRSIGYRSVSTTEPTHNATIQFVLSDGDGATSTPQTETIQIHGVNQGPVNAVPGDQTTNVNIPLQFASSGGNRVSASDPDAGSASVQLTLSATNGTLTLNFAGGLANPVSNEALSNSTTTNTQSEPAVARAPNGRYVVVWSGYRNVPNPAEILFQLYDAGGNPSGGQTIANSTTANTQSDPDVAMDQNGNFVIVWTSLGQDNPDLKSGIYGQRFNAAGNPIGGEFLVNTTTVDSQSSAAVAMDADGDFVVAWVDKILDGSGEGVFAQRFNAAGIKVGSQFQVNTYTFGKQLAPDVAMDATGNFVITWDSAGQDFGDGQSGVYARRYDASGAALSGEILVNTTLPKEQNAPSIAMNAAGDYVIVWTSKDNDGSGRGIFGQLFDSAGNPVGPTEFQVNTTTALEQRDATVAMDANGNFTVVWESINQDNPGDMLSGVYVQQFDRNAAPVGVERLVNTTVSGVQDAPVVAMDADGDFVVAWQGNGAGDASGVFHSRYDNSSELSFTAGDGSADTTMTFSGSLAAVNSALDGMQFTPNTGFIGLATVTLTTNDLGNTGSGGAKQDTDTINITVLDAPDDVGPVNDSNGAPNAVNENAGTGTTVGITAFATDPNAGDTVSYSLDDNAAGRFTIDSISGVVTVADGTLLDYEVTTSHNITVRATSTDSSFSTRVFTISVLPVNDNAPVVTSSATPSLNENQTNVQTLTATDADLPAQTITFAITGGADAAKFLINGANQLVFVSAPDFENPTDVNSDNVYEVQVTADDGNGALTPQLISVSVSDVAEGNVLVVDTTADIVDGNVTSIGALLADPGLDGRISLREAVLAANNTPNGASPDEIRFSIPNLDAGHFYYRDDTLSGSLALAIATVLDDAFILDFDPDYPYAAHSWFRIQLNPIFGELVISDTVIVDGYAQPGATQNTLTIGNNAAIRIELTSLGPDGMNAIHVAPGGTGSTIRGLAINGFDGFGIAIDSGADGVAIEGNFVGTDITGTQDLGNGSGGVQLRSSNTRIGGANLEHRNVISGNSAPGVVATGPGPMATGNVIQNNYIGVDATGLRALGNDTAGVEVWNQDGLQIYDNVVSGNNGDGIGLRGSGTQQNTVVQGNRIGTAADGSTALANSGDGIVIESGTTGTSIGGVLPNQANTIWHNAGNGIAITGGTGSTIRGNSIANNGLLGIDIVGTIGVDTNDSLDADAGPNLSQNYPVLASAIVSATSITVTGTLNSTPSVVGMVVDFYWSPTSDGSSFGEGANYIGSAAVSTDASGVGSFAANFAAASVPLGGFVTATATDPAGNTSEFARNVVASVANTPPIITSSATPALEENQTIVYTLTASDSDVPAQTITFSITGGVDAAFFTIGGSNELMFIAAPDFETPTDFFLDNVYQVQVTADDGNGGTSDLLISVTVTPVNDLTPTITSPSAVHVAENSTAVAVVTAVDADLPVQPLTYLIFGGADAALFAIDSSTGALSFRAAPDFESPNDAGADNVYDVIVEVSDGALRDTQAIAVTVTNQNEPPTAVDDNYLLNEDMTLVQPAVAGVLANDGDVDGDPITAVLVSGPAHAASFSLNPDGSFSYTPLADFHGIDSVRYKASDGAAESNTVTVTLTVAAVNDPPLAVPDRYSLLEGTTLHVPAAGVLANDSDIDGPAISAALVGTTSSGLLIFNSDGSFTYTPNPGFSGIDSFTYEAADGTDNSIVTTVTIQVVAQPVSVPPVVPPGPAIELPSPSGDSGTPVEPSAEPAVDPAGVGSSFVRASAERPGRSPQALSGAEPARAASDAIFTVRGGLPIATESADDSQPDQSDGRWSLNRPVAAGARRSTVQDPGEPGEAGGFWQDLDAMRQQLQLRSDIPTLAIASVVTSTVGLSVGYVVWLLRGGILISSLLSSMPAWRLIDPLPILENLDRNRPSDDEDDESLESIIQSGENQAAKTNRTDSDPNPPSREA